MDKNKRLAVWLPVIIALSIALGIFVGNHYLRLTQGKRHIYSSGNKINAILDIIDEQYVDTVDMKQLCIWKTRWQILSGRRRMWR